MVAEPALLRGRLAVGLWIWRRHQRSCVGTPGDQFREQFFRFLGVLGGQIVTLCQIVAHVEQFQAAIFIPLDQLPIAIAHRAAGAPP